MREDEDNPHNQRQQWFDCLDQVAGENGRIICSPIGAEVGRRPDGERGGL